MHRQESHTSCKIFSFFFPAIFEGPRFVEIRILLPGQRDVTSSPLYSSHRISGTATFHPPVLRRQPTFRGDATTGFPAKLCPRNESRNSILMISEYPGLGSACDWLKISSSNQKHYPDRGSDASSISGADYGPKNFCPCFSGVISREASGGVAKCRLFSQAILLQSSLTGLTPGSLTWRQTRVLCTGITKSEVHKCFKCVL